MLTAELHSQTELLNHSTSAGDLQGGERVLTLVFQFNNVSKGTELFIYHHCDENDFLRK